MRQITIKLSDADYRTVTNRAAAANTNVSALFRKLFKLPPVTPRGKWQRKPKKPAILPS